MPRVVAGAVRKRTTQTGGKNDGEMEDVGGFKAMHRLDSGLEDQVSEGSYLEAEECVLGPACVIFYN